MFLLNLSSRIPVWEIDLGSVVGLASVRDIPFLVPEMVDQFSGPILGRGGWVELMET